MQRAQRANPRSIKDDFDGAWKNMLTEARCSHFVALFLPDIHPHIDWSRPPVFLEQELRAITRKTKRGHRSVDRLVKVWLLDGTERWLLIHIEIQTQQDPLLAYRMFQYYFRALDLFEAQPILGLAILADETADWRPDHYTNLLWETGVEYRFRAVKLKDYEDRLDQLEHSANPFARFVLAHLKTLETQGQYETRLEWKLRIIKGLYSMALSETEIGQLSHDFDWLLALPETLSRRYYREITRFEEDKEMAHQSTAERIGRKEGRKEGRAEGRVEGRVEGRMEGMRELLLLQGSMRFGAPDDQTKAALEQITMLETLQQLAARLLVVESWQELLASV
jgi:hypothetical protein